MPRIWGKAAIIVCIRDTVTVSIIDGIRQKLKFLHCLIVRAERTALLAVMPSIYAVKPIIAKIDSRCSDLWGKQHSFSKACPGICLGIITKDYIQMGIPEVIIGTACHIDIPPIGSCPETAKPYRHVSHRRPSVRFRVINLP